MRRLRVVVVDDEPLARERIAALVRGHAALELAGEARNGLEALDLIADLVPDLVMVDVEMPVLTGFGVVTALDGDDEPGVIFVTAYDEYAVRAFEVGAIDYLLKPVTPARFAAAVERAQSRLAAGTGAQRSLVRQTAVEAERARGPRKRYVVRLGRSHQLVPVETIVWIEAADNYLRLHTTDRTHLVRGTIRDAEAELDGATFVRIHRSRMVATAWIEGARRLESGAWIVRLRSGAEIRASRQYAGRVREILGGAA